MFEYVLYYFPIKKETDCLQYEIDTDKVKTCITKVLFYSVQHIALAYLVSHETKVVSRLV